jgi:hypothetical protein
MEHNEKRASHCAESQKALGKIADSLLYYVICDADGFSLVGVVFVGYLAGNAKSRSMEWSLRNKTIREWNAKESGNEGRESEQPKIPMEAGRFSKRELGALGDERRD